jgi:hypothetical protein
MQEKERRNTLSSSQGIRKTTHKSNEGFRNHRYDSEDGNLFGRRQTQDSIVRMAFRRMVAKSGKGANGREQPFTPTVI